MNNSDARKTAKLLKWSKGIKYKEMADEIGLTEKSFYNWVGNEEIKLGYKSLWKLNRFFNNVLGDEEWKK